MRVWWSWFNRERIILLLASLTLVQGALFPWYRLPPKALETFGTNLFWANLARFIPALLAIAGLALVLLFRSNRTLRLLFWSAFIGVLLYPYLLVTWSPSVTFIAKAYSEQGERVTMHVESNFNQIQSQWKQNINLAQSRPLKSIFDLSIKDSRFFQPASWEQVLKAGFGYSNSFFNFIGRGWSFTAIGVALALLGLYIGLEEIHLDTLIKDIAKLFPWASLLVVLILTSFLTVNIVNYQIDTLFVKGEYNKVIKLSKILKFWYPPLQGDEAFLARLAKAGLYSDHPEPALISFVKGLERYSLDDYEKAVQYFQQALDIQPKLFLARGYLATTILNQGVDYLKGPFVPNRPLSARFPYKYDYLDSPRSREGPNNSKPTLTAERCEQALKVFPDHLEALYDLMIVRVINAEFDKSASLAQQIIEMQQYFQQPMLALSGQAYLHLSWKSYQEKDLLQAWQRYRQSIDPSTWKESVEAEP